MNSEALKQVWKVKQVQLCNCRFKCRSIVVSLWFNCVKALYPGSWLLCYKARAIIYRRLDFQCISCLIMSNVVCVMSDILGDGTVHPSDLIGGPLWLRAFRGNELRRLTRKLAYEGRYMKQVRPAELHRDRKQIFYLYKLHNRNRSHSNYWGGRQGKVQSRLFNIKKWWHLPCVGIIQMDVYENKNLNMLYIYELLTHFFMPEMVINMDFKWGLIFTSWEYMWHVFTCWRVAKGTFDNIES